MRDFPMHESLALQLHWEVFNLAVVVLFGPANNNFSSGGVSQIRTLPGELRVIGFRLRLSF
jgi:hypothetical protein